LQIGDDRIHRIEHRGAFGRAGDFRQPLVPEDPPVEMFHHIKGAADHRVVLAQREDARHRHRGVGEPRASPGTPVDRMGARQQRPGGLRRST